MIDIDAIGRSIAAVTDPTAKLMADFDAKARDAIIAQKRVALEMTPADVRALTRAVNAMLDVHRGLYRSLKEHHALVHMQGEHIAFLNASQAHQRGLVDSALALIVDIKCMGFFQLLALRRKLRGDIKQPSERTTT